MTISIYFNKLEQKTSLTKKEIVDKLNELTYTGKYPFFKLNFTEKIFLGQISSDRFYISQVVKGRNSFIPVIQGEIIADGINKIVLKMRLHFLVIIFLAFITGLIIWFQIRKFDFGGSLFLVFFYGMTTFSYINECKKVRRIFEEHFSTEKKVNA